MSLILLLTTTGITITEHYCGSDLVSVKVLSKPDKCCDNSNCCHENTITVKLNADILNTSSVCLSELSSLLGSFTLATFLDDTPLKTVNFSLGLFEYSDLSPPTVRAFLSKLAAFLL